MSEHDFLVNLAVALLAAALGGLGARLLRMPVLVGYLLAGILVGPHTPGVTANSEAVHAVAKLGVALLIFAIGVQFHLKEMLAIRKIALVGGSIQILGTIAMGWLVGLGLGWGSYGGAFLGCALALSSTAVMMRLMEERGELGTTHSTAMLGILVVQDLAVVLMMALLPAAAQLSQGPSALVGVGLSILRAIALVAAALLLASRGVPWLLERIARVGSQELFLLAVVCVCLGAAFLAERLGLSLELGAFLAGLVISESDYSHEVFSQVRPLRDLFASLFFVSIGMLLEPNVVAQHAPAVAALVATIVIGKALLAAFAIFVAGAHGRTAIVGGLGLAQIGEFSFVLASVGTERKLIPGFEAGVILAAALISILLTPVVYGMAPKLYQSLIRVRGLARLLNRHAESGTTGHVETHGALRAVVLGCGRVGKHVSRALEASGVPHVVVDYDAEVIGRLRAAGVPVVYGDATSDVVLRQALGPEVELAVVALPEASMTPIAVRALTRLKPDLPIIARVHHGASIPRVRDAGADVVVHAEFEAATTIIRDGLGRLGVPEVEVEAHLLAIRAMRYRTE